MSDRVDWACGVCGKPIEDGTGGVSVARGGSEKTPERWHSAHDACRDADTANEHSVPVVELRTEVEVIHATAHLLETGWLPTTDWFQVLLNVTDRGDTPVSM